MGLLGLMLLFNIGWGEIILIVIVVLLLFGGKKIPGGIFVLNIDLVLPLVMYAQGCGLTVGQDYKLLIFDDVSALKDYPGIGMMHQAYPMFQSESLRWLESGAALSAERFESLVKTEFILHS